MNPVWELFLIVALLYLSECWVWLPNGARFIGLYLGRAKKLAPPASLSLARGGLVFASPLPWDLSFRQPLYDLIVSTSLAGKVPFSEPGGSQPTALFDHLSPSPSDGLRAEESGLFHGKQRLCPTLSHRHSRWLVDFLNHSLKKGRSAKALGKVFSSRLDQKLQTEIDSFRSQLASVRVTASLEWLLIFAVFPVLFLIGLPASVWWSLLGFWAAQHCLHLLVFWRTHRVLFAQDRPERWSQTFLQAVAPTLAMRAAHRLALNALPQVHPLLLLTHFGNSQEARTWAETLLRDLQFPNGTYAEITQENKEPWETFRQAQIQSLERFLAEWKSQKESLTPALPQPSGRATHYCPRCWTVFIHSESCHLCANRATLPFSNAASPETQANEKSA